MTTSSTLDALSNLTNSIPDWNKRLDDLNGQIAQRQIELAQLTDPPPARSLKNKGSTESLRPKDGEEALSPITNDDDNMAEVAPKIFESPKPAQNGFVSNLRPNSPSMGRAAAAAARELTPPPSSSTPKPSPNALTRQSSQPTPPTESRKPNVLRKRKTESLASAGSQTPKYRTRSMIIVWYDSAVQKAFEDLVRFVSANRNAMRKGKMAAKMAEMRRAAELEAETASSESEEDGEASETFSGRSPKPALPGPDGNGLPQVGRVADSNNDYDGAPMPALRFVSTRQMGPTRDRGGRNTIGNTMSMLKGYRRAGGGETPDIFDELDKGLEWCQSQCEHAAHQFLRDGECSTEIENIRRRLCEVKESAEREVEKLKKEEESQKEEEAAKPRKPKPTTSGYDRSKKLKTTPGIPSPSSSTLEVDDGVMEVDDEEDDFDSKKLIFKRSRDVARRSVS